MKKLSYLLLLITVTTAQQKTFYDRADSVLKLMTLEEKVGQLVQYSGGWETGSQTTRPKESSDDLVRQGRIGSFLNVSGAAKTKQIQKIAIEESRLKIPLIFGIDVIHGFRTTFPVPIAEASSWNPELIEKSARYQAIEASSAGINWTFNPMVDIARDPRWGRIVEGSGEDPYLGSQFAVARVKGYQGKDLKESNTLLACVKHYAAYGGAEAGRDYNTVELSERNFRDYYLPPYKAAVEAGVGSLMASFNEISGVPSSASKFLLTKILREEWKSDAFVVSDWNSIGELIQHGVAKDLKEAAILGIEATVDMDMEAGAYYFHLIELVKSGKVNLKLVDDAVKRVLIAKFKLGLFENPYRNCNEELEKRTIFNKDIINVSLEVANESIVLLKNEKNILPLSKNLKQISVFGELASSKDDPLGAWDQQGDANRVITVIDGIKNKVGKTTQINYVKGCNVVGFDKSEFQKAIEVLNNSDIGIVVVGEKRLMGGEAQSRSSLDLPGVQEEFVKELQKTGKPIVVILMNSRPLTIKWIAENCPSIIEAWYLGIESGNALSNVLFGEVNPSGKLPVSFPQNLGQVPIYYNHKNTGRPYTPLDPSFKSNYNDVSNDPLFPFGYGLSYSKFNYSDLKLSKKEMRLVDTLKVLVKVKNNSEVAGTEVIQLYVQDLVGSVTRPVKELKDFKKIFFKPGETKNVEFILPTEKLKFHDINLNYVVEPGNFKVFVGTNSVTNLEEGFTVF